MKNFGYIEKVFKDNVKKWQIKALERNPGIVDKIKYANKTRRCLDSVYGPVIYKVEDYFDSDVVGEKDNKKLCITLKELPADSEIADCRFLAPAFDKSAITDYSGAKEFKIRIDATKMTDGFKFYFALEDLSKTHTLFSLKENSCVTFKNDSLSVSACVDDRGFVCVPNGFKGDMIIKLSSENLQNDLCESDWDFKNVGRFQIAFNGTSETIGKPFYITEFLLSYKDNSEVKVWDFLRFSKRSDYRKGLLPWYGEFVGKHLTGIVKSYRLCPSSKTKKAIFQIVQALASVQWADGYLGVYNGCSRYSQFTDNWDLWNHYHAIIGLIECYKIFKDELSYSVAKRALDCIYKTFKNRSYIVAGGKETNRSIAHAYAEFYTISNKKQYLLESERIILQDCQEANGWYQTAICGGEFFNTDCTRWEMLHTVMTLGTLYRAVKKPEYLKVLKAVWNSIIKFDVHNNGGFSTNEGAGGNPYADGVIETCCTIAWMALTCELFECEQNVLYADAFELSYYNSMLGCITTGNAYCTYNTPMNIIDGTCGIFDGRRVPSQVDSAFQYLDCSPDLNCCQANVARGLGEFGRWAYYVDNKNSNLYVNYLGNAEKTVCIKNDKITIIQQSEYPVGKSVKFTVKAKKLSSDFCLNIRIPSWADGATATINGNLVKANSGSYLKIDSGLHGNDEIVLNLDFDVRLQKGKNEQENYYSVYYGPILLALEGGNFNQCCRDEEILISSLISENVKSAPLNNGFILLKAQNSFNKEIILKDFASAGKCVKGKYNPYWSWIKIKNNFA